MFVNHYECPRCGTHRADTWSGPICARISPLPTQLPSMSRASWPAMKTSFPVPLKRDDMGI